MRGLLTSRFASARTFREGSVGLLLLLGLGVFGLIILWLTKFSLDRNSYKAIVEFANAGGIQKGAPVRYRGVKVGTISAIRPGANNVEVEIEITKPKLIMPSNVSVEANQSGLIGENILDITPKTELPPGSVVGKPLDKNCNPQIIVCNNSRLKGQIGISTDELIRSSTQLATVYSDQKFYSNVNRAVENTAVAAANIAELSRNFTVLSKNLQQQLNSFSATTNTVQKATTQLSASSTKTLSQFGNTADQFSSTAKELRLTNTQVSKLINNLDNLVTSNRSSLVAALNNITETSNQLRKTVSSLSPAVNRVTQGELIKNLETLSANAAQASANLRQISNSLNNPNNVVVLQQTLDSARVTFENTQKITSDLDELTGDPAFRKNLRQLVNGLSSLVSSTQQIQEHTQIASTLDSVKAVVNNSNVAISVPKTNQEQTSFSMPLTVTKSAEKTFQPSTITVTNSTPSTRQQQMMFDLSPGAAKSAEKTFQPTTITVTNSTPSTRQQQMMFDLSPGATKSAKKTFEPTTITVTNSTPSTRQQSVDTKSASKQPQPTSVEVTPSLAQENLLRKLREHRQQEKLGE
ncbi:MCE family protein [Brasilonema octagenarum UFV-E1]|uniref:MCE family protein n=1 Tax=Brasilonema sennae CENA114 TaxID=415709 RepID=A0A856MA95_9CYAN|nr:MlaD family protein [Brasilonema sennae]QDL07270.1 MCE family protein [Brasilonema sennae CENA114]QDL13634.1 MCE family protein [Brasilonema octagenarum UFV-E1]